MKTTALTIGALALAMLWGTSQPGCATPVCVSLDGCAVVCFAPGSPTLTFRLFGSELTGVGAHCGSVICFSHCVTLVNPNGCLAASNVHIPIAAFSELLNGLCPASSAYEEHVCFCIPGQAKINDGGLHVPPSPSCGEIFFRPGTCCFTPLLPNFSFTTNNGTSVTGTLSLASTVPEIDPASATTPMAALLGGLLLFEGGRRKQSTASPSDEV